MVIRPSREVNWCDFLRSTCGIVALCQSIQKLMHLGTYIAPLAKLSSAFLEITISVDRIACAISLNTIRVVTDGEVIVDCDHSMNHAAAGAFTIYRDTDQYLHPYDSDFNKFRVEQTVVLGASWILSKYSLNLLVHTKMKGKTLELAN